MEVAIALPERRRLDYLAAFDILAQSVNSPGRTRALASWLGQLKTARQNSRTAQLLAWRSLTPKPVHLRLLAGPFTTTSLLLS